MPSLNKVLAVILGGGRGSRLYPLTTLRSKPAVPIAGKYRLIDIPISNCINSGIYRIAVLTQFNSVSLHRHIVNTYNFDVFHQGWVQIWAAEQTTETADWYQGTADAVRKQLFEIESTRTDNVLILAGDHLYRMDYSKMVEFHWDMDADITIAVQPVRKTDASRFGLLKRTNAFEIKSFAEKPTDPQVLAEMVSRDDPERPYLGSMGIYLFKKSVLFDLLKSSTHEDFGKHIIPLAIQSKKVYGYDFDDYWEDIGTIRSFYETNLALIQPDAKFNLYDPDHPIYTHPRFLPGSSIHGSKLEDVLLAEGCRIENAEIINSIVGARSQISASSKICNTILMGSDYYDRTHKNGTNTNVPLGIGENVHIEGAIIDKNPHIASNVVIKPFPRGTDMEGNGWVVRDGIVVVPKNTTLFSGTYIGPERD